MWKESKLWKSVLQSWRKENNARRISNMYIKVRRFSNMNTRKRHCSEIGLIIFKEAALF